MSSYRRLVCSAIPDSQTGPLTGATDSHVKAIAQEYKTPYDAEAAAEPEAPKEVATDPTVAHATKTEIETGDAVAINGHTVESITDSIENVQVADNAANAVAQSHWDSPQNDTSLSQEWVQVPRDPKETETGLNATPAVAANTQSWADDHPEQATEVKISRYTPRNLL